MAIKDKYSKLAKTYNLPDFDKLNNEFEIFKIEKEDFLLREIRKKIAEQLQEFIEVLDSVLQPDAVISDMQECHAFTDDEKGNVYNVYKKLMYLHRYSLEVSILGDEKKDAEFIVSAFNEWVNIKKELSNVISRIKDCWKKESDIHEVLSYLG